MTRPVLPRVPSTRRQEAPTPNVLSFSIPPRPQLSDTEEILTSRTHSRLRPSPSCSSEYLPRSATQSSPLSPSSLGGRSAHQAAQSREGEARSAPGSLQGSPAGRRKGRPSRCRCHSHVPRWSLGQEDRSAAALPGSAACGPSGSGQGVRAGGPASPGGHYHTADAPAVSEDTGAARGPPDSPTSPGYGVHKLNCQQLNVFQAATPGYEGRTQWSARPPSPTQVRTTGALGDFRTAAGTAARPADGPPRGPGATGPRSAAAPAGPRGDCPRDGSMHQGRAATSDCRESGRGFRLLLRRRQARGIHCCGCGLRDGLPPEFSGRC